MWILPPLKLKYKDTLYLHRLAEHEWGAEEGRSAAKSLNIILVNPHALPHQQHTPGEILQEHNPATFKSRPRCTGERQCHSRRRCCSPHNSRHGARWMHGLGGRSHNHAEAVLGTEEHSKRRRPSAESGPADRAWKNKPGSFGISSRAPRED